MKKPAEKYEQLKKMYAIDDARASAPEKWAKLPTFWFILFLSYACTRRCVYCYSFNQLAGEKQMEMDDAAFARLLEWIPEVWRINNVKVNYVGFLGGEPLLRTDRIKQVMDSVYANTDGMQGALNTNADLVDTTNWDNLEGIQWITTNITDLSIDELSRRMAIIRERSNALGQTITVTLDEFNLNRMLEIARFGIENGYRLRYQKNIFRGLDLDYQVRALAEYHKLCDLLEEYVLAGFDVHTTFLLDTLIPLWEYDDSPYPCGKKLATVFPDGSVGPCIRDHDFKTGTIFDPNPLKIIYNDTFHYDLARQDIPDECRVCESRTTCQGGCPHDKLLLKGSRAGKSLACEIHKQIIPRLRQLEQLKRDSKLIN